MCAYMCVRWWGQDMWILTLSTDVVAGYNGTVFAYGQTGSGKTYTMMGSSIDDQENKGIIPRIIEQIFTSIQQAPINMEFTVKVAYMEIYMERVKDLLVRKYSNTHGRFEFRLIMWNAHHSSKW